MVKDVIDGLKLVKDGIDSVKSITEAVNSGMSYVKTQHPEVQIDLRAMVDELGKSMYVIKQASAVLTNFRFAISADAKGSELARFNKYFIQSKAEAQHLRDHIDDLRSHCRKIEEHGLNIAKSAKGPWFLQVFNLLGLRSPVREKELGEKLGRLATQDYDVANSAYAMLNCLDCALKDVQNTLGNGGAMYLQNVPHAAALLAEYGPQFEDMEKQAAETVEEIRTLAKALQ